MRAEDLLQDLSWALYVLIFVLVAARAARRPTRAHIDVALFFGVATLIIVVAGLGAAVAPASPPAQLVVASSCLLMGLPYLLLRLVSDFARVPRWLMRASGVGLLLAWVAIVVAPTPLPTPLVLLLVAYFVGVVVYDTLAFVQAAQRGRGVTRRRMQAAAAGSACLALILLLAGVGATVPASAGLVDELGRLGGLASALCYVVAFAPPTWLRRAWQEPELREFLRRAARLPHLPDTRGMLRELERGAADSLGGTDAALGVWDPEAGVLRFSFQPPGEGASIEPQANIASFVRSNGAWELNPTNHPISGRAFCEQRALLIGDAARADPANAGLYAAYGAHSVLAAPVTAGDKRLGVLVVYAPREPVFANSDLELIRLLADQAAVIVESRTLLEQAARVRAREEATRLKEDFLSSAAHDLKTPLTGILSQAQLMQRRAARNPDEPADRVGLDRLVRECRRLKSLVLELLDASRIDADSQASTIETVDLAAVAREVCVRERAGRSSCVLHAPERVAGSFDPVRIRQLLEHLVDNAVKFSPRGTEVSVDVWREDDRGRIAVTDRGIGIPPQDLPALFQRFHRGSNVDDRRFAGLGLGLYICRRIVEQHGGRIWAESTLGQGSVFQVELPLSPAPAPAAEPSAQGAGA